MGKRTVTEILADDSTNWKLVAGQMRASVPGHICKHTEVRKGFWSDKWGCGRKIFDSDRCKEAGPTKAECREYLRNRFDIDDEGAGRILDHLYDLGYIEIYKCNAVFYNVPAEGGGMIPPWWVDDLLSPWWDQPFCRGRNLPGMPNYDPSADSWGRPIPPLNPDGSFKL
mgnify:CR=1 FL=1